MKLAQFCQKSMEVDVAMNKDRLFLSEKVLRFNFVF